MIRLAVYGEGSTKGWITGILPFSTEKVRELATPNVLLRCYNMTGTVRFRTPMILKKPAGIDMRRSFELADGTEVFSAHLQLRR